MKQVNMVAQLTLGVDVTIQKKLQSWSYPEVANSALHGPYTCYCNNLLFTGTPSNYRVG